MFLNTDKPFKILKQGSCMFRISFLEDNFSRNIENELQSEGNGLRKTNLLTNALCKWRWMKVRVRQS